MGSPRRPPVLAAWNVFQNPPDAGEEDVEKVTKLVGRPPNRTYPYGGNVDVIYHVPEGDIEEVKVRLGKCETILNFMVNDEE